MADELHEAFLRLFTRCEPELRAFVRSCLPRLQDVDEVMQEVNLVAWRKFGDLDDRGRFAPWACLIDLPPSAIPVFKLVIHPRIDQPCAAAEA